MCKRRNYHRERASYFLQAGSKNALQELVDHAAPNSTIIVGSGHHHESRRGQGDCGLDNIVIGGDVQDVPCP